MPDKKLTDNEIVKALECCRDIDIKCETCQLWTDSECTKVLHQATIDLINRLQTKNKELDEKLVIYKGTIDWQVKEINRLQAENSNLTSDLTSLQNDLTSLQAENERLNIRLRKTEHQFADIGKMYSEIKAEAYKEFEEKISGTTWYHINKNGELVIGANGETDIPLFKAEDVFNLLKELVGEDNG